MQRDNGRINYGVTLDNSQLRIDAQQSKRIIEDVGSTAVSEGNKMDNALRKVGTAMAGVFAVAKLKEYVTEVAKVRGEFQQLEIAFNTMLGSKAQADALMSQLIKTAATTPFNMGDIANSAKQLLAYGVEAEKVNETLIRLGDIAAGLSIPINDLAYLYGTTMVQGRLYTQDLNQFLGRGIPLTAELAKQFGVTESKVKTLVTEGKVGFPEVEKAIIALTSEGGKFGGLMEAQSKSITGQISNLEDSIEQMFNEIGKSSEGVISDSIGIISSLVENWRTVGSVILSVVAGYGAYKAAVITMNVVQKINNMLMAEAALQQKLAAMSGVQLSTAQAMAAAKTTLLTAAMNGLKAAIMSNPIGLILGVIATAITAFTAFSSSTSKATEMSKKFGDTAANTITRINTLTTTLKGLSEGTSTHKKVTDELNEILKEYGITQIKEGDNIDTVNKKREQAIELIKQEAIERQRANALDTGMQDYQTALNDAKTELRSNLESTWIGDLAGLTDLHKELEENAAALTMIVGNYIDENISKVAGKTGEEYSKGLKEIFDGLKVRLKDAGFSDAVINEFTSSMAAGDFNKSGWFDYIKSVKDAAEQYDRYTVAINAAADAEKAAADSSMTWSEKIDATKRSLQGANDDVHKLYTNIKNLMSKYNKNTIGFDIVFNAKVPKWMESMKLSELKNLAAQFSALGDQAAKQGLAGMNVNGKYFTTQQLLQRGAEYAQAAENKQSENDRIARENEANEKERKRKAEQAKKKAETERKQIADQTADRNKAIQKYTDDVAEAVRQSELDIQQQRIDILDEGYNKSRQTIDLHYRRLTEENRKRMQDMIEALADNKLREWLNENPKATKEEQLAYRNSLLDEKNPNHLTAEDLTEAQQSMLNAYGEIAEQIRQKELQTLYGSGQQAMLDYLKQYGTFQEQKLAIATEYAERIKQVQRSSETEETKQWQIASLRKEQQQTEQSVEANAIMARIDWYQVFGNVGGIMKESLTPLLDDLKAFVNTDKFQNLGADQQKQIIDAMANIRQQIGSTGDLGWRDLAADLSAYQTALQEATQATIAYKALENDLLPKLQDAQRKLAQSRQDPNVKPEEVEALNREVSNLMTQLSQGGQAVTDANKKVTSSGQKLAQTTEAVTQPIDDIHNFLQDTGLSELQSLWDSFKQLQGGIDGLKALSEVGKTTKEIKESAEEMGDSLGEAGTEAVGALSDGLSKAGFIAQIIGAVLKILDILKDGIGTLISSLIDTILNAVNGILENILSGKFIEQIVGSLIKGVGNIIDTITGAIGSVLSFGLLSSDGISSWLTNSNAKEVAETTERLTNQNEALQHSIDKLKDSIDKNYGGKAITDYQKALKAQEQQNENMRQILNAQQGYHSAHHSNAYYWYMGDLYTQLVNQLLGTNLRGNSWGDWAKLTPEQMEQIRTYLPQVWTAMLDQGKYDKSDYFEQYADQAGKIEELTEQIKENLMNTSFESLRDSFIDQLMDMETSAEDFADNFEELMQRALLRAAISNKFDEQIQAWYDSVTAAMMNSDGSYRELSEDQLNYYRNWWNNLTNGMIEERDRLADLTGYTNLSEDEATREASKEGIATASQESVDELNGRATVIQGHTYSISENTKLLVQSTNLILKSVQQIERNTDDVPQRLANLESNMKAVKDTVNDIALKGIKIKT